MPSKLTRSDVLKIAELARLELAPKEVDLFATQLTAILEYAAVIEQVDTSAVPVEEAVTNPGTSAADPVDSAFLRPDTPASSLPRQQTMSQAPDAAVDAGLFRVPKVL